MRSRLSLCCVLLTIALATPSAPAQAPTAAAESQGPDLRQAEEQVRALRAALKDPATPPESWGVLMMTETVVLRMRALQAAGGGPVDEAALAAEQRKLRDRIFAEWKAARPADATPYLAEMQGTVPAGKMDDAVLALLPRFPDDFRLLSRCVQILVQREQTKSAAELVDAALQRHPDRFEAYGLAVRFYGQLENASRQRELAEAWIDHLPGDPNGLRAYLDTPSAGRDPREAAARVERFVGVRANGGADATRVEVCGWLLSAEGGAYRDAALRCLSDAAAAPRDAQVRTRAAGLLAGTGAGGGSEQEWERSLAELPPERRQGAILAAVSALGEGQCDRKMALLRRLPPAGGASGGSVSERFGALRGCETDPAARAAFLDAVAHAPAGDLTNLLLRWFPKVNGSFQEDADFGLAPQVVAALEARRQSEAGQAEVWQALDEAYQLAGRDDRRAAHLAAWSAAPIAPPSGERLAWLAEYRAAHDGPAAAVATLRAAWGKTHDEAVAAALGDALLAAGKLDDFTALVDELAARAAASEVSHPTVAILALRLRARGALVRQGPAAALPAYEAYVEQAPYLKREEAAEYLFAVAAARGPAAAEPAAQALCARPSMQSGSSPTQCAADLLATLGHNQGALRLLEAAAQRAPEDLRLQASFAQAAEQAGELDRAEAAYRRLLAADPKSEGSWSGLGRIAERRGDPRELQTLLHQAEQARGDQPPALVLSLARVELARGEPQRAADLLLALRERFPDAYLGEDELRQAYRDLAAATPASPPSPTKPPNRPLAQSPHRAGIAGTVALAAFAAAPGAGGAVRPPSAEDLRAMRESEAAMLGIGAPVNEAKGREIARRLAAQGNAYANIRLSIWQQAGTQGMTADARQAAATARPYLAPLKAAAEAGEPYAEYLWGTVLLRGIGVPKAAAEGGTWLRKAAAGGEPWALHNLGWMAENGDGARRDLQEALRWYRQGAAAGNAHSLVSLATLRINGDKGDPAVRQPAEGVQWLAKAAEKGLPEAEPWYGAVLLYGLPGVAADPAHARPWLEKGAARDVDSALYDLGAALLEGVGGPADPRRGVALLERVAAKGNARAMWQLAWQSALGQGTAHDGQRGEQWIERAAGRGYDEPGMILGTHADQGEAFRRAFLRDVAALEKSAAAGDAFAGGLLARLYQMGIGVREDDARAVALARRAAAGGSVEGMRVLAWQYRMGQGVEADAAQAAAWFRRCAEGGNSYCMMWYSQALFRGDGGKVDQAAGLTWLERAGELGNAWAVRDLGNFYDAGTRGIPRDLAKATYWKRKALAFDDEESRGWLIAHHLLE